MTVDSSKRDSDTRHILESSVSSLNTLGSTNEINQERNEEPFNYDDILDHIGQLGKSQLLASILLLIPGLFPGIVVMSYTITGYIPKYGYETNTIQQFDFIQLGAQMAGAIPKSVLTTRRRGSTQILPRPTCAAATIQTKRHQTYFVNQSTTTTTPVC